MKALVKLGSTLIAAFLIISCDNSKSKAEAEYSETTSTQSSNMAKNPNTAGARLGMEAGKK